MYKSSNTGKTKSKYVVGLWVVLMLGGIGAYTYYFSFGFQPNRTSTFLVTPKANTHCLQVPISVAEINQVADQSINIDPVVGMDDGLYEIIEILPGKDQYLMVGSRGEMKGSTLVVDPSKTSKYYVPWRNILGLEGGQQLCPTGSRMVEVKEGLVRFISTEDLEAIGPRT